MCKIEFNKEEIIAIYKSSSPEVQQKLIDKLGVETFKYSWKDIKTVADALKANGKTLDEVLPFKNPVKGKDGEYSDQESINAYALLIEVARAVNEDVDPNYNDSNEAKYEPRFLMSGSGFSYGACVNWCTGTGVGSRLCYRTHEKMMHVVSQPEFLQLYKQFMKKQK